MLLTHAFLTASIFVLAPGCKRLVINTGYLAALNQPNVVPCFEDIQRVTSTGIVTSEGTTVPAKGIGIC